VKNPLRHLTVVTLVWLIGLAAGVVLLYTIGPHLQAAADTEASKMEERWWHLPLLLIVALGPGAIATVIFLRSDDPAV
jgi:hypothetical protein